MSNKHKGIGEWAKENGFKKWEETYHPENKNKRQRDGIRYYNRRHQVGEPKNG
jgi:hypothetical protein